MRVGTAWKFLLVAAVTILGCSATSAETLILDGASLTAARVVKAARDAKTVIEIDAAAAQRLEAGFDLVMEAATQGSPVYGLTVGVGWNKDRPAFEIEDGKRVVSDELLRLSREFNRGQLRAHGGGFGESLPIEVVRASMVIRLNQMLTGMTGVQPAVADMYRNFLNEGITPVVPARGSIGQADITLASHIGLAMVGEWYVDYQGKRMPAAEALAAAGISPISPVGKDFLSIISSNSLSAGRAALLSQDAERFLQQSIVAFGLALEGYNGNVAPFLPETTGIRPFAGMNKAASMITDALEGSYLWSMSDTRGLQDPLSFRTMAYAIGAALEASEALTTALEIHINHTDDNPATITGNPYAGQSGQVQSYRVAGDAPGAIYPTANFEMLPVTDKAEQLNVALTRMARSVVMQTIRYENPTLTQLPRFLAAPGNRGLAFGAMQVPLTSLYAELRMLAMPVSLDSFGTSAGIEDVASNSLLALANLDRILELNYQIASMQLLHATQAVDLRGVDDLGDKTKRLYHAYRAAIPFVDDDRAYTEDLAKGIEILKAFQP